MYLSEDRVSQGAAGVGGMSTLSHDSFENGEKVENRKPRSPIFKTQTSVHKNTCSQFLG